MVKVINPSQRPFNITLLLLGFIHVLLEGVSKAGHTDLYHYDANLNPCRQRDFWRDIEESPITAICFYDYVDSMVYHEKEMSFSTSEPMQFHAK